MRINVLALGESLIHHNNDGHVTVGVNDIHKFCETDYIVCVDHPRAFSADRLKTICGSVAKKFFTHLYNEWRPYVINLQQIELGPGFDLSGLRSKENVPHSNNSAFVACCIAYKLGATEIVVYGADFKTHGTIAGTSADRAVEHFGNLKTELSKLGCSLYVCCEYSRLSEVLPIKA